VQIAEKQMMQRKAHVRPGSPAIPTAGQPKHAPPPIGRLSHVPERASEIVHLNDLDSRRIKNTAAKNSFWKLYLSCGAISLSVSLKTNSSSDAGARWCNDYLAANSTPVDILAASDRVRNKPYIPPTKTSTHGKLGGFFG
jgi:hypothetical protein